MFTPTNIFSISLLQKETKQILLKFRQKLTGGHEFLSE